MKRIFTIYNAPALLWVLLYLLLPSCGGGEKTEIASAKSEPADFRLAHNQHAVMEVDIPEGGTYGLKVQVVYDTRSMVGFEKLNLHGELKGPGISGFAKDFMMEVGKEGSWKGQVQNEEKTDYLLESVIGEGLKFEKGKYTFTLSPAAAETRDINGMVLMKAVVESD